MSPADPVRVLAGAVAVFAVLAAVFRNADRHLPAEVTRPVAAALRAGRKPTRAEAGALALAVVEAAVGPSRPALGLIVTVLRQAGLGLLLASIFCLMAIPGYAVATFATPDSALRFLTRFGANAVVTVVLVCWASAAVSGHLAGRLATEGAPSVRPRGLVGLVIADLAVRFAALVAVTAASFSFFADVAGSFGGSARTALDAIPETLAYALGFRGLSGIYVYAALFSAFPLYLALMVALSARSRVFAGLWRGYGPAGTDRPVRFFGTVLAALAALVAFAAALAVAARPHMLGG